MSYYPVDDGASCLMSGLRPGRDADRPDLQKIAPIGVHPDMDTVVSFPAAPRICGGVTMRLLLPIAAVRARAHGRFLHRFLDVPTVT